MSTHQEPFPTWYELLRFLFLEMDRGQVRGLAGDQGLCSHPHVNAICWKFQFVQGAEDVSSTLKADLISAAKDLWSSSVVAKKRDGTVNTGECGWNVLSSCTITGAGNTGETGLSATVLFLLIHYTFEHQRSQRKLLSFKYQFLGMKVLDVCHYILLLGWRKLLW